MEELVKIAITKGYKGTVGQLGDTYSIIELSILQKWLREVYDIHIFITCQIDDNNVNRYASTVESTLVPEDDYQDYFKEEDWFLTYEEALEDGIEYALKLI